MTTMKKINSEDITNTATLLHESIPITGSILSGTYVDGSTETNILNHSHGIFQAVYDYPYQSSSANHIFDITTGYSSDAADYTTTNELHTKKANIYNQMAQVLVGYDSSGNVKKFSQNSTQIDDAYFVNFSRLLMKDEIKKGTFKIELGVSGSATYDTTGANFNHIVKLYDKDATTSSRSDSPAGEYGYLYASSSEGTSILTTNDDQICGLVYYQAGVAVVSSSVFLNATNGGILNNTAFGGVLPKVVAADHDVTGSFISSSIQQMSTGLRNRVYNIEFSNTTELHSTIYRCRANHKEFNFSTNPTYLSGSEIRVKGGEQSTPPHSYITTVGLYSADNELLAVAKLSEPIKKTPSTELNLRVRLDY